MSRSWERQVRKNQQKTNTYRQKSGQERIGGSGTSSQSFDTFKGRNYMFPVFLLVIALFLTAITISAQMSGVEEASGSSYWFIIVMYLILAVIMFLRRPFLRIGKDRMSTIRFNRERTIMAGDIAKFRIEKGYVTVETKGKGANWIFSRFLKMFKTDEIAARVTEFAEQHQIPVEKK
ncbi:MULTISPECIES: hypothetical protein [Saccharibacillus]|uniref:Methyltransferase n=1 Tax=Saccharibacillus brassicae TaxID=2583377 RepID=A0A4Y6V230_SACBS|nr:MULTISPECIES: hypothetical protein [Saccharibacillus]MWJ30322.1 hypothetical protein [Saccharibacillus sp. WB 17]QDH23424.1 hypothetical protein FFV09_22690 [Saccharibacillus brassicae]